MFGGQSTNPYNKQESSLKKCREFFHTIAKDAKHDFINKNRLKLYQNQQQIQQSNQQYIDTQNCDNDNNNSDQNSKKEASPNNNLQSQINETPKDNIQIENEILIQKFDNLTQDDPKKTPFKKSKKKFNKPKGLKKILQYSSNLSNQKLLGDDPSQYIFYGKPSGIRCQLGTKSGQTTISMTNGYNFYCNTNLPNGNQVNINSFFNDNGDCLQDGIYIPESESIYILDGLMINGSYIGDYSAEFRHYLQSSLFASLSLDKKSPNNQIVINLKESYDLSHQNLTDAISQKEKDYKIDSLIITNKDSFYQPGRLNKFQFILNVNFDNEQLDYKPNQKCYRLIYNKDSNSFNSLDGKLKLDYGVGDGLVLEKSNNLKFIHNKVYSIFFKDYKFPLAKAAGNSSMQVEDTGVKENVEMKLEDGNGNDLKLQILEFDVVSYSKNQKPQSYNTICKKLKDTEEQISFKTLQNFLCDY